MLEINYNIDKPQWALDTQYDICMIECLSQFEGIGTWYYTWNNLKIDIK